MADQVPPHHHHPAVVATSVITGFVGVTALGGGAEMLASPHGNRYLPVAMLEDIPGVRTWRAPGVVLGGAFGLGSLVTTYGLVRQPRWRALRALERRTGHHWSWTATMTLGVGMVAWISTELAVLPERSFLEGLYGGLGLAMVALPVLPAVERTLRMSAGASDPC